MVNNTNVNSTIRGDTNFKYVQGSDDIKYEIESSLATFQRTSVGKTEITCLTSTRRTSVEAAESFIIALESIPWVHHSVTWGQNIRTTIGHLPLTMTSGSVQLIIWAKGHTNDEDTIVMANYFKVINDIVSDCIVQTQYTGGKAYIGPKGIIGIALTGLYLEGVLSNSSISLTESA